MLTTSNPPTTVSVPVATTAAEGKTKVDNNMTGDPIAITTHSIGIPSGVAELDAGGLVPVAELPLDVAYTDIANEFTETQTVTDGTITPYNTVSMDEFGFHITDLGGNTLDIFSNYQSLNDGINASYIYSNIMSLVGASPLTIYLEDDYSPGYGQIQTMDGSLDVSLNMYSNESFTTYNNNGPATNIHQDVNGTIHLQVAPVGMASANITWTDAIIVNIGGATIPGSGALGVGDSPGFNSAVFNDSFNTTDSVSNGVDINQGNIRIYGDGPTYLDIVNLTSPSAGILALKDLGLDLSNNTFFSGSEYAYQETGNATNIHQDIDGSIHFQTATGVSGAHPIVWNDSLIINADGTIDLASTPTTTTAPSAGMADALPLLPTGYATIDIGGTPRKVAYY